MSDKYDLIYSVGANCGCSMYMLRNKLRSTSGPFDWLTHANFETRMKLILRRFEHFLEIEDLKFLPKDPKMFNDEFCDYYENTANGFYYFHDFPKDIPLDESFPEVKEKYARRCNRFLNNLDSEQKILLLWFSRNGIDITDTDIELCSQIHREFNSHPDFLLIEHDAAKTNGEKEISHPQPFITKIRLKTQGFDKNGNELTMGDIKNCMPVFRKPKCKGQFKRKFQSTVKKAFVKAICLFVPYRPWRKKIKKRFNV